MDSYEIRIRVKLQAEGPNDAREKAEEIVSHLCKQTHNPPTADSVFCDVETVAVVEVIPTI